MIEPGVKETVLEIEHLLDSLLEDTTTADARDVVARLLLVASRSQSPSDCVDLIAKELESRFWSVCPDDESRLEPPAIRHLDALRSLALLGPHPGLAWAVFGRLDQLSIPTIEAIADLTALLAIPSLLDKETRAEAAQRRGDAHDTQGSAAESVSDWEMAFALTDLADVRTECAASLAIALAQAGEPVAAANWAWRVAEVLENDDAEADQETLHEVWAFQLDALKHLYDTDGPIVEMRTLVDRMLEHVDWRPGDVAEALIYVLAASASIQDNDVPTAREQLRLAARTWDVADEYTRAQWQITRGEAAAIEGDVRTLEDAIRHAAPYVSAAGDDESRTRLEHLLSFAAGAAGSILTDDPNDPTTIMNQISRRIRAGSISPEVINECDRAMRLCNPATQAHLVVILHVLRSNLLVGLQHLGMAADSLTRAREALSELSASQRGGIPADIDTYLDLVEGMIALARHENPAGASVIDQVWRRELAAGRLARAAASAMVAARMWLDVLGRPPMAMEAAIVALTAIQELRYARADSGDRDQLSTYYASAHRLAIEAAEAMENPELMAETLEVIRTQAVPFVNEDSSTMGGPLDSMMSLVVPLGGATSRILSTSLEPSLNGSRAKPIAPRSMLLPPPPLIQMPWGSVALAQWVAYPVDTARHVAVLRLADFG